MKLDWYLSASPVVPVVISARPAQLDCHSLSISAEVASIARMIGIVRDLEAAQYCELLLQHLLLRLAAVRAHLLDNSLCSAVQLAEASKELVFVESIELIVGDADQHVVMVVIDGVVVVDAETDGEDECPNAGPFDYDEME